MRQLGEGGMGAVYLAEHTLIGRRAAVKVLLPEYCRQQEVVGRFFNEARATTTIRHPGIVEIYDFGYHSDHSAFIVMEFLEGETLTERIARRGRMSPPEAAPIVRAVASALSAAHDQGIVHRDLKPDNIFLVADSEVPTGERPKILDFGIAKLTDRGTAASASSGTRTGVVMGTPTYMAPEQCRGAGRVDHRADIYALGCIWYEMLCGTPPFRGEGVGDIIAAHITAAPTPPSHIEPTIPQPLENLLLLLLAKRPEQRIQSMRELQQLLGRAASESPPGAPGRHTQLETGAPVATTLSGAASQVGTRAPAGRRRAGWWLAGGAIAAVVAGAVVALVAGGAGEPAGPSATHEVAASKVASSPPAVPAAREPAEERAAPAAPVEMVALTITTNPEDARVLLDGVERSDRPIVVPRGSTSHRLTVRAAGHVEQVLEVRADADRTLEVTLEAARQARPAAKPVKTGKPAAKASKKPKPAPRPKARPKPKTRPPIDLGPIVDDPL